MCFIAILSCDLSLDFWALRCSNVATLGLKAWLMEDRIDNPCEAFIALIEGKGVPGKIGCATKSVAYWDVKKWLYQRRIRSLRVRRLCLNF